MGHGGLRPERRVAVQLHHGQPEPVGRLQHGPGARDRRLRARLRARLRGDPRRAQAVRRGVLPQPRLEPRQPPAPAGRGRAPGRELDRRAGAGANRLRRGIGMAQSIREVMTADPRTVDTSATVADAAREMREGDVGSVVVVENGNVAGILTDRDIAVRVVAQGLDPDATRVSEAATMRPTTLTVDQTVDDAIRLVREQNIRRILVVQDGRPAGIVSLGDLAIERDTDSALADIASEPANN